MIDYRDPNHSRNRRRHAPPQSPAVEEYRTPAQRDRDRILYTSAFRRLAEVTQVASPEHGHVFHNRLTHSLQVAQVGRRLAEKLRQVQPTLCDDVGGVDPDAVEAACLAHDLGHPPFGHVAEEALNALAKGKVGGFEGNAQSFRVVTKLAFKSVDYPGLDLTRATLAAILKYPWRKGENKKKPRKWGAYTSEERDFRFARKAGAPARFEKVVEAELMDWADDVTFSVHDVEDFYRAGSIPMHLLAQVPVTGERRRFFDDVYRRHLRDKDFYDRGALEQAFEDVLFHWRIDEPYSGSKDQRSRLRDFTAKLIGRYVKAVELDSSKRAVVIDETYVQEVTILKELTWTYVIEAPALATQQEGQRAVVKHLFDVYSEAALSSGRWGVFPAYYRERLTDSRTDSDKIRIVVDLIAGMSEPEAIATYRQLTAASPTSSLEQIFR